MSILDAVVYGDLLAKKAIPVRASRMEDSKTAEQKR